MAHTISYLNSLGNRKTFDVAEYVVYNDGSELYTLTNGKELEVRVGPYGNRQVITFVNQRFHGGTRRRIRVIGWNIVEKVA
jgi:hypothetical protein